MEPCSCHNIKQRKNIILDFDMEVLQQLVHDFCFIKNALRPSRGVVWDLKWFYSDANRLHY